MKVHAYTTAHSPHRERAIGVVVDKPSVQDVVERCQHVVSSQQVHCRQLDIGHGGVVPRASKEGRVDPQYEQSMNFVTVLPLLVAE